jgi:N-acetylglutamate synthase-like GNAT family acetyltransferase
MIEARPIRESEADTFLRLLCDVFGLDYARARTVFYTEPYFDIQRKWALFVGDRMVSVATTTPLKFGWGDAVGIAGVATRGEEQGQGYACRLLERILEDSNQSGENGAVLFAHRPGLYQRVGFEIVDEVVRSRVACSGVWDESEALSLEEVRQRYEAWAGQSPDRLRRDDRRWRYWQWNFRTCVPYGRGYLTIEPGLLREAVLPVAADRLPLPPGTDWFGSRTMLRELSLPVEISQFQMHLMTRRIPRVPQFFMTDQF